MADRLKMETLRSLVATLSQTMRYGTPLGQALRVLANEMRRERLVKFEKAARLPVLITLPMIGFILPCVFIVVAGPAALDLVHLVPGAKSRAGMRLSEIASALYEPDLLLACRFQRRSSFAGCRVATLRP
jgi:tight adherence protein C